MDFNIENMHLTEKELREFQFLYYQFFHKALTRDEATKEGLNFIDVIQTFLFAKDEKGKCFWEY